MLHDQALIAGTDVAQETRLALANYRQALRDIPETSNPSSVVWPQKPW
ncbi:MULTISPECIES: phage tail assembly chaperone [Pseudomonas]